MRERSIVYLLSSLPSPPGVIKEINCLLYDFLWDSKGDKIKRTEMTNEYNKGGLEMIDLESFNESLKIKWIKAIWMTIIRESGNPLLITTLRNTMVNCFFQLIYNV